MMTLWRRKKKIFKGCLSIEFVFQFDMNAFYERT